jgi:RNA polymerase sigma-70 factor (ECF subfamily)
MKESFLAAYDQYADALFRHCLFKVHDREIAKDILQETFTKTWLYISRGNEVKNMRAFLYKTLNNLVIDQYRKKQFSSLEDLSESGFEPRFEDGSVEDKIDGEMALKLLDRLPEMYKEAIFLRFVNGLELSEIADITGESENTIAVHVHRGLKQLKELFDER